MSAGLDPTAPTDRKMQQVVVANRGPGEIRDVQVQLWASSNVTLSNRIPLGTIAEGATKAFDHAWGKKGAIFVCTFTDLDGDTCTSVAGSRSEPGR